MRQEIMAEGAQLSQFDDELYKVTGEWGMDLPGGGGPGLDGWTCLGGGPGLPNLSC